MSPLILKHGAIISLLVLSRAALVHCQCLMSFGSIETILIWTVHTKQAKSQGKERGRTKRAASRRWTAGLGNTASQARTPKRGARAGTGSGRARVSSTMTAPGRAGRTCRRGSSPGGPPPAGRGARAPPEVKAPKPPQRVAVGGPRPVLRASDGRGGGEQWTTWESPTSPPGRAGKAKEALLTLFL